MSAPMLILTAGASLGIGAAGAQVLGGVLSKPITGETVPSRLTDLVGYLTASGAKGLGFEDPESETSVGLPEGINIPTAPTINAPRSPVTTPGSAPANATSDKKRMLAVASIGGGLLIAVSAFFLIRRVTS